MALVRRAADLPADQPEYKYFGRKSHDRINWLNVLIGRRICPVRSAGMAGRRQSLAGVDVSVPNAARMYDSLRRTIEADVTIAMAALRVLGIVALDHEAGSAELTELGRYAVRRLRGMAQPGDPLLQLRVTLADVDDPPCSGGS